MSPAFKWLALAASLSLVGCAERAKPLYHWQGYQEQVYEHFKSDGEGPQAQIAALEASLQDARARNETPPPGFHAHLGMLYAEVGKADQVQQQFETEKALFPESAPYMDFLLRNAQK